MYRRPRSPAARNAARRRWVGTAAPVAPTRAPAWTRVRNIPAWVWERPSWKHETPIHRAVFIGSGVAATDIYAPTIIADEPYVYWRMGGTSGDVVDEMGVQDLTVSGATRNVTGALTVGDDGAISFDGSNDFASAALDLSDADTITVEWWMNWDSNDADDDFAMEFTSNANGTDGSFNFDWNNSTGGEEDQVSMKMGQSAGGQRYNFARPPQGEWHYYAMVLSHVGPGGTGGFTSYVDGEEVSNTLINNDNMLGNFADDTLYLMSRNGSALFGAGDVDEFAIYKFELTEEQVAAHYAARLGGSGTDTTAPTINVTVVDVTKISSVVGRDSASVTFTANEAFVEYEVRLVSSSGSARDSGTQIETATVGARTSHTISITDDELIGAGGGEGDNLLKVFAKDAAGNWSA